MKGLLAKPERFTVTEQNVEILRANTPRSKHKQLANASSNLLITLLQKNVYNTRSSAVEIQLAGRHNKIIINNLFK